MASIAPSASSVTQKDTLHSTRHARPTGVKVGKDDDGTDGNKSQTFEIHKGILRYYSGYFRTAVDNIEAGRFKESEEGLISLPDEEPSMFRNFKDWMYARSFRDARSASGLLSFLTCIKVWCFADRCDVPSLQNEIMDYLWLRTLTSDELPAAAVRYAWDNTLPDSALRRYLMQFIVCIRPELADKHHHEWSAELLWDLLVATRMQPMPIGKAEFVKRGTCENYHVHAANTRCLKGTDPKV